MTKLQAAFVLALAGATLVIASAPVDARWNSFAHGGLRAHGYYRHTPYYGGTVAVPFYGDAQPSVTYVAAPPVIVQPPRVLNCQRSREVVTVPAEAGGTREIAITRC